MSWITTVNNRKIDFRKPDPKQILIEDIATGLSNMPRFAGQLERFYSVAEHCILAERYYFQRTQDPDPEVCKAILMHDATEAFMCDVPTPLKKLLEDYQFYEDILDKAIKKKFRISSKKTIKEQVREYDILMLKNEALHDRGELNWLSGKKYENVPKLDNFKIYHMPPALARDIFLKRWRELQ